MQKLNAEDTVGQENKKVDPEAMPKIDLHCHLDGSIEPFLIRERMERLGEKLSQRELMNRITVEEDCPSLVEYLKKFDLPIRCIQYADFLRESAYYLARRARSENVVYLEVRYAPQVCLTKGMTLSEAFSSVVEGLERAHREFGIGYGVIACAMRHLPMEENLSMLREAAGWLGRGVVCCDLAGDEQNFPNELFDKYFEACRECGMPMILHSGEQGNAANVETAIRAGAKRIGHGIAMRGHDDIEKLCRESGVGVEMCPTSNFQTKAVHSWEEYPLREFMDAGIAVSVNTDNRTVSGTSSTAEFEKCIKNLHLTNSDLKKIYLDSVEMSFATQEQKFAMRHMWTLS